MKAQDLQLLQHFKYIFNANEFFYNSYLLILLCVLEVASLIIT